MKYMASTRPTVRNMIVNSRPCASGCRATPAMVWLPARPSPMAAPTAPPPISRPPPTMAPARLIAWSSPGSDIGDAPFGLCYGEIWVIWRSAVDTTASWAVSSLMRFAHGGVEVEDREQGEDEGLDGADGEVEELPHRIEDKGGDVPDGDVRDRPHAERRDEGEHEAARQQVAEESERQGEGLGDLFHPVDEDVDGEQGLGEGLAHIVLDVADHAATADRGDVDRDDHDEGERQRDVDIARG